MSDGPYKSLPMRKSWKDASERAHKQSFSEEERAESMCVALKSDFMRDAGRDYFQALGNVLVSQEQGNLLADQVMTEIENINNKFSQSPLRDNITEHIHAALHSGLQGEAALVEGVNRAVKDHGQGCIRQVEEHYKRDAKNFREHQKADSVRNILQRTLASEAISTVGNEIIDFIRGEAIQTRLVKASGLEDGPVFS